MEIHEGQDVPDVVKNRPPSLCQGCGHSDVFVALNEVLLEYGAGRVFSDIGCYTLAALPPYNSINSCVDMGASIHYINKEEALSALEVLGITRKVADKIVEKYVKEFPEATTENIIKQVLKNL